MQLHALDMANLLVAAFPRAEQLLLHFTALVPPDALADADAAARTLSANSNGSPLAPVAAKFGAFDAALEMLLDQALQLVPLTELHMRLNGLQQQQRDAVQAWCLPLLKLAKSFGTELSSKSAEKGLAAVQAASRAAATAEEKKSEKAAGGFGAKGGAKKQRKESKGAAPEAAEGPGSPSADIAIAPDEQSRLSLSLVRELLGSRELKSKPAFSLEALKAKRGKAAEDLEMARRALTAAAGDGPPPTPRP